MIWGGAPAQYLVIRTIYAGTGGTIVTGNCPTPISALAMQVAHRSEAVESLAGQRGEEVARIESVASERLDTSLFGEALAGRLGDFAVPTEPGASVACDRGIPADILVARRSDYGAPVEALGAADTSVASDAMLPVEMSAQQHSGGGMALEDTACQRSKPEVRIGAIPMLMRDGGGPIEWLTSGVKAIADAAVALEWDGTAPTVVPSLETGPGRIRLLATPGRARLLRRN